MLINLRSLHLWNRERISSPEGVVLTQRYNFRTTMKTTISFLRSSQLKIQEFLINQ